MSKTLNRLPSDINGRRFKTDEGVKFEVHEGDYFSDRRIGRQHSKYLGGLRVGLLVSVSFYGKPVPLVTVDGGVVKLDKVEVDGALLDSAAAISKKLGLTETRQPVGLYAL
jgi:hypothetical protein